jgi:hypothetical protein
MEATSYMCQDIGRYQWTLQALIEDSGAQAVACPKGDRVGTRMEPLQDKSFIILSSQVARIWIVCHGPEPQGDSVTLCQCDSGKTVFATLLVHCVVHLELVYNHLISSIIPL